MTRPANVVVTQPDASTFWDKVYSDSNYSRKPETPILQAAICHFGSIPGKTVMELGCGPGAAVLYFAGLGANVIAVDVSSKAITDLAEFCSANGIKNVHPVCENIRDIKIAEPVDFIYGSMILHHIEPFEEFAMQLRSILKHGGKAFFYENNAASRLLVWFRQHVVGKFWVPKRGDKDEFPLTPQEIDILRKYFDVQIVYPEMMFFMLISNYLMRDLWLDKFRALDRFFYRRRWLLSYSYRQYVMLTARD